MQTRGAGTNSEFVCGALMPICKDTDKKLIFKRFDKKIMGIIAWKHDTDAV